ncbi:MAG TPA: hypothetical protein VF009_09185 [Solirubrobacterales bacterium]
MSDLVDEIQDLLEAEARGPLGAGWAEVRLSEGAAGMTLHLEPMKLGAAPLEIYFDSDELVVCYPGRNSMVVEFFSEDPEEIKPQVQALTAAVVAGSYSERKKEGATDLEAEWPGIEGTQRAARTVIAVPGTKDNPWREISYEAY